MYRKKEARDRCLGRHWHLRDKQEKKRLRRRKGKTIRTAAGKWRAGSMHKQRMGLQDGQAEGLPLWSSGSDAYLPNARVPGSIPGQRTRTHRPQLRGHMPRSLMAQQMLTILRATTKNCCSQINGKMDFYKKWRASGEKRQRLPWNQRLRRRLCHYSWWSLDQRWARQRPGCADWRREWAAGIQTVGGTTLLSFSHSQLFSSSQKFCESEIIIPVLQIKKKDLGKCF